MIHHSLDGWAEDAATRYAGFTAELNSHYVRALTHPDGITPARIGWFQDEIRQIAYKLLARDEELARQQFEAVAKNALTALQAQGVTTTRADVRLQIAAHLSASGTYLNNEVFAQVQRDINAMTHVLTTAQMTITGRARLRQRPSRAEAVALLLERPHLDFFFTNRAGRRIPAAHHLRLVWRQTLLSVHNETVLMALSAAGQSRAAILINGDNGLEKTGEIALLPGTKLPTYLDVREDLFHPNSRAFLGYAKGPRRVQA